MMAALKPRGMAITGDGRKALTYCDGRWNADTKRCDAEPRTDYQGFPVSA